MASLFIQPQAAAPFQRAIAVGATPSVLCLKSNVKLGSEGATLFQHRGQSSSDSLSAKSDSNENVYKEKRGIREETCHRETSVLCFNRVHEVKSSKPR